MTARTRFLAFTLALGLVFAAATQALAAQAYIVIDSKTGYVLDALKATDKRQVGSLTKVATAMVVLDWAERNHGDLNQVAVVPPQAFAGGAENLVGFQPGDRVTLRDLLYAALVQSDNVAAYALADHVGQALRGIVPAGPQDAPVAIFVGQMNALAKTLGMPRTLFSNPHGIDTNVKPLPYSTAMDMARLARYAMNKPAFRFYVSQKERKISFNREGKQKEYSLRNTNELLGVNGVDGVKTGRTARAGDCLILSAQQKAEVIKTGPNSSRVNPRHLLVVLLGSTDRFGEGRALLERGWQMYDQWVAGGRLADPKKFL
ncbi:MAG: serine hydrolase [Verrucomicrobiota bacterium]|nr:serine hydrolase [Verrucomicrobiota bacterium]